MLYVLLAASVSECVPQNFSESLVLLFEACTLKSIKGTKLAVRAWRRRCDRQIEEHLQDSVNLRNERRAAAGVRFDS